MASTLGSRTWLGSILTAAMASTMAIVTTPGLATTVLLRNSITPGYYKGADGSSFSYYYGNGYGGSSLSYTYGYGQYAFPPQLGSPEPAPGRSNLPPSVIPPTVPVSVSVTFADVPGVKVNHPSNKRSSRCSGRWILFLQPRLSRASRRHRPTRPQRS